MKYYESKYTGAEVDALLTKVKDGSITVDIEKELADKANVNGRYPEMSVGTADDLAGRGESVPASFGFRASGGKSIKDGRAYIKRIKGNSVVWNQKYKPVSKAIGTQTINGVTFTISEDGTVEVEGTAEGGSAFVGLFAYRTFIASHKYLLIAYGAPAGEWNKQGLYFVGIKGLNEASMIKSAAGYKIFQPSADGVSTLTITAWEGYSLSCRFRPIFIDLTKMFQAGNEPTTIEEFYARVATLGIDMYAYNEGQVIHCNTESIKSVGDNAWDEEWKRGYYMGKEYISVATNQICSANPIPCLPNEAYCVSVTGKTSFPNTIKFTFLDAQGDSIGEVKITNTDQKITTPINATSFLVSFGVDYGGTYKNDILISLYHSGWKAQKDDQYQPYWQDILPLPIIRKYFPQGMKSAGSAHDEIRYNKTSGKWEYSKGKIKGVDLGDMEWVSIQIGTTGNYRFKGAIIADFADGSHNTIKPMLSSKYATISANDTYSLVTGIAADAGGNIYVYDPAYTDAATFKAAMKGVILYYEAAEWEWEELDAEDQNFRDYYNVADFGTEEAIPATDAEGNIIPSAAFSADIIYQFNAVDMIREHEIEINELQSIIATMQAQLASLTSNNVEE